MSTPRMFTLPELDMETEPELVLAEPGAGAGTGSENQEPEPGQRFSEPVPGTASTGSEPEPGTTPAGSEHDAGTGSELVLAPTAPGERIGTGALLLLSARERAARFAAEQKRHRTFWHRIWEAVWVTQPESFPAHRAHLQSKTWLEPWMDGWVRVVFDKQNILFGFLIARPAKCACRAVVFAALNTEKLFDRQYRFWIAAGVFLVGLVIYLLNH